MLSKKVSSQAEVDELFRRGTPLSVSARPESFNMDDPLLSVLDIPEQVRFQNFFNVVIVGWFAPTPEANANMDLVKYGIVVFKKYYQDVMKQPSASQAAITFCAQLHGCMSAILNMLDMQSIIGVEMEEKCRAIKELWNPRSENFMIKTIALAVIGVAVFFKVHC